MLKFGIGQSARRLEDPRLLTGRGMFTDDVSLPHEAHGYVLRSPHGHAAIRGIDISAAKGADGVLAIYTADDLAELGTIQCVASVTQSDGTPLVAPPFPVLATGRALYVGQPVAFVVGETLDQAKDAAELIVVDYQACPAVVETGSARSKDQTTLWEEAPRNTSFIWADGDASATDSALESAPRRLELHLVNNRLAAAPIEPRIAIGDWDDWRLILITTSQGPHSLRQQLAEDIFGVPEDEIRVVTHDVGGGFGMKIFLYSEQPLVMFAARDLGRPVRWTGERSADAFLGDYQGRDQVNEVEVGYDDEGKVLALRVRTSANLGAFVSNFAPYIATECGAAMLSCVYAIPAISLEVAGVFTNTVPVDAYRGAGHPEAIYVVERALDAVARATGLDTAEIRRRNFIQPAQLPYTTAMQWTYDSGDFETLLDKALERADYAGFAPRKTQAAKIGKLKGFGVGHYVKGVRAGMGEAARIEVTPDGVVTIYIGNQSNGQGHETVFAQVVGDRLGIDLSRIRLVQGDTDAVATGHGTGGSRSILNGVPACDRAAVAVIENGLRLAADRFEAAEADIEYKDGVFSVVGTDRRLDLATVAAEASESGGLGGEAQFTAEAMTFPNGCHVCEVEIDRDTGATRLLTYIAVDDFGRVVNPLLLEAQVQGGVVQGIGQALMEDCVYDPAGQLLSGSFMDYCMPRAKDLPPIEVALVEDYPCTTNDLGIKGAGEAGAVGAPPAVVNAILDALAPLGVEHIDMPVTSERVWRAIREGTK